MKIFRVPSYEWQTLGVTFRAEMHVLRRQGHIPTCKEVTTQEKDREENLDLGHVVAPIFVGI